MNSRERSSAPPLNRDPGLGKKYVESLLVARKGVGAECLDVKLDRRLDVLKSFFVGIALGYDDSPQSDWVSDEPVRMLLNDHREVHGSIVLQAPGGTRRLVLRPARLLRPGAWEFGGRRKRGPDRSGIERTEPVSQRRGTWLEAKIIMSSVDK